MLPQIKRSSRLVMTDYHVTDGFFREYPTEDASGDYINPKRITVSIDPDTTKCAVTFTGPVTRRAGQEPREATSTMMFDDWATALDDPAVTDLVRAAIVDTARWSDDLSSMLHSKHLD